MSWLYPVIPLIATALLVTSLIVYQGGYEERQDLEDVKASMPEDMGYVIVKVTERDHDGLMLPILEPKDLELWHPFNTYIIFVNELGYEVKVTMRYMTHSAYQLMEQLVSMLRSHIIRWIKISVRERLE